MDKQCLIQTFYETLHKKLQNGQSEPHLKSVVISDATLDLLCQKKSLTLPIGGNQKNLVPMDQIKNATPILVHCTSDIWTAMVISYKRCKRYTVDHCFMSIIQKKRLSYSSSVFYIQSQKTTTQSATFFFLINKVCFRNSMRNGFFFCYTVIPNKTANCKRYLLPIILSIIPLSSVFKLF